MFFDELLSKAYLSECPPREDEVVLLPQNIRTGVDDGLYVSRPVFEELLLKYRAEEPMSEGAFMSIGKAKDDNDPLWNILLGMPTVVSRYSELCNEKAMATLQTNEEQEKLREGQQEGQQDGQRDTDYEGAEIHSDGDVEGYLTPEMNDPTDDTLADGDGAQVGVVEGGSVADTVGDTVQDSYGPEQPRGVDKGEGTTDPETTGTPSDRTDTDVIRALLGQPPISMDSDEMSSTHHTVDSEDTSDTDDSDPYVPPVEYVPGQTGSSESGVSGFNPWAEYDAQNEAAYRAHEGSQSDAADADTATTDTDEEIVEGVNVESANGNGTGDSGTWDVDVARGVSSDAGEADMPGVSAGTETSEASRDKDVISKDTDSGGTDCGDVEQVVTDAMSDNVMRDADRAMQTVLDDFIHACREYGAQNVCTQSGTSLENLVQAVCEVLPNLSPVAANVLLTSEYIVQFCQAIQGECRRAIQLGNLDIVNDALQPLMQIIYLEV